MSLIRMKDYTYMVIDDKKVPSGGSYILHIHNMQIIHEIILLLLMQIKAYPFLCMLSYFECISIILWKLSYNLKMN